MFRRILPAAIAASSLLLMATPAMAEDSTAKEMCVGLPAREQSRCLNKASKAHRQSLQAEFRTERRTMQEEQKATYSQLRAQWRKSREALQGTKSEALRNATSADERQTAVRTFREQHRSIMDQKKEDQRAFREELRSQRETLLQEQRNTARISKRNASLQQEEHRRLLNQTKKDRIGFSPWWEDAEEEDSSGSSSSEGADNDAE